MINSSTRKGFEMSKKVETMIASMKYAPSNYQTDAFCAVDSTRSNIVIAAVAGSGKTTTIIQLLDIIPASEKVLFLAFNKEIQKELHKRVTEKGFTNVQVLTCHAFGFKQLTQEYGKKIRDIDANKYIKMLRRVVNYALTGDSTIYEYGFTPAQLAFAKANFVIPEDIQGRDEYMNRVAKLCGLARLSLTTDVKELEQLGYKHDVDLTNGEAAMALALAEIGKNYVRYIDYTDMIYLPLALRLRVNQYDTVIVDECQDLNNSQRELMLKACTGGRFIAVGDKAQAIYAFAGADSESFDKLVSTPNTIELPLSLCYRCGSDIIEMAKNIMPTIEAHSSTGKGNVNNDAKLADIQSGDLVLCRNNAPLVKLCMKYLQTGVKAVIKGQDIGKSIIKLVENTGKSSTADVLTALDDEKQLMLQHIAKKQNCSIEEAQDNQAYTNFADKCNVVAFIGENCNTADDITACLERLFSDDNTTGIQLSSIHRAKGLEANNVFIIHRELMPSPKAKQDWQIVQENNLMYVAYTRAKKVLGFITDFDANAKNENKQFAEKINVLVSKFIAQSGDKVSFIGTVQEAKNIFTQNGQVTMYRITDVYGNIWIKWGFINTYLIASGDNKIVAGTKVQMTALIKEHKQYKGENLNVIKSVSKYDPKCDISFFV